MISAELPDQGMIFWPVGTGDSTTIVIDDSHVVQIDIHDMAKAADDEPIVAAVVDRLVEVLPNRDGKPYLSLSVLTHADQDHCLSVSVHARLATWACGTGGDAVYPRSCN